MRRLPCGRYLLTLHSSRSFVEVLPLRPRRKGKTLQADSPDRLEFPSAGFQIIRPVINAHPPRCCSHIEPPVGDKRRLGSEL